MNAKLRDDIEKLKAEHIREVNNIKSGSSVK